MHTFWITFYSYKGGVGRSMALANVASQLAAAGRRVVMVDFDLEAPGLDSFEEFGVPAGKPGLVEYVCEYLQSGRPAKVEDYLHEVHPSAPDNSGKRSLKRLDGKLWLMTSGAKDESYNHKRLSIDWTDLYESRSGVDFFENFKADIEDTLKPDYVLIDSRTGLTDVGGVCTLHLPDLVVLLFALNEQNLKGIASVAQVLRKSEKLPQLIPVATPVPNIQGGREGLLDERYQRAKELLGTSVSISLPYSPIVALKEQILEWPGVPSPLCMRYRELAEALKKADPAGIDFLKREAEAAMESLDLERASEIGQTIEADYSDRADAWLTLADIAKSAGDLQNMERALRQALEISPNSQSAFKRLDALLRGKKRFDELLALIADLLSREDALESEFASSLQYDSGELLMKAGRPAEALPAYEAALRLDEVDDDDGDNSFPFLFNVAEARRRATGEVHGDDWKKIVSIFEKDAAGVSALPLAIRANQTQAMHIAYACIGDIGRAKALLNETSKIISQASPQERVFCVADYENIPLSQFIQRNEQMLESLDRGQLWDGMML